MDINLDSLLSLLAGNATAAELDTNTIQSEHGEEEFADVLNIQIDQSQVQVIDDPKAASIEILKELQNQISIELDKLNHNIVKSEETDEIIEQGNLLSSLENISNKLQQVMKQIENENISLIKESLASMDEFKANPKIQNLIKTIAKASSENKIEVPAEEISLRPQEDLEPSEAKQANIERLVSIAEDQDAFIEAAKAKIQIEIDKREEVDIDQQQTLVKVKETIIKMNQELEILNQEIIEVKEKIDLSAAETPEQEQIIREIQNNQDLSQLKESLAEIAKSINIKNPENSKEIKEQLQTINKKIIEAIRSIKDRVIEFEKFEYQSNQTNNTAQISKVLKQVEIDSQITKVIIQIDRVETQVKSTEETLAEIAKAELLKAQEKTVAIEQNNNSASETDSSAIESPEASSQDNSLDIQESINKINKEASSVTRNESKELNIKLKPRELGELNIKISKDSNNQVTIKMQVQNENAINALKAEFANLSQNLRGKGIDIKDIEISKSENSAEAENSQRGSENNEARDEQKRKLTDMLPEWLRRKSSEKPSFKNDSNGIFN